MAFLRTSLAVQATHCITQSFPYSMPHRRVDDRKHAERQAHVQRRAEEAARPGRGYVNPFPLDVKRALRSAGRESDQVIAQAPTLPAGFRGMHVFYSAVALEVLLDKLTSALSSMADEPRVTLKHTNAKVGISCVS